jgi:hypothetical protein
MRKKNSSIQSNLIKFLCIYFFIFSLDTVANENRAKEIYFEKKGLNVNPDSKGFSFFNAPSKPQINNVNTFGNLIFLTITTPSDFGSSGIVAFEYTLNGGQNWIRYNPSGPPINYNTLTPNSITSLSVQSTGQPTFVQIRAVNGSGAGLPSDRFPLVARLEGSPSSPEVVRADADSEVLRLTIKAPTSPGNSPVTGYQYSLNNGQ